MWCCKDSVERMAYQKLDGDKWVTSQMPPDVANELIRRSDSYRIEGDFLVIDGGIRFCTAWLERLVA